MSTEPENQQRRRFGRREVIVIGGILGLAACLIVPAMLRAREDARRTSCNCNLKQIGLGIQNFHDIRQEICPSYLTKDHSPASLPTGFSTWAALLQPFMEQQGVYDLTDNAVPLDEPSPLMPVANHAVFLSTNIATYHCPSRERRIMPMARGDYASVALAEAVPGQVDRAAPRTWDAALLPSRAFNASSLPNTERLGAFLPQTLGPREYRSMTTFKSIRDGLSNTAFLGEKAVRAGHKGGPILDLTQAVLPGEQDGPVYYGRGGNPADLSAPGAIAFWSRRLSPRPGERLLPLAPEDEVPQNRFGSWHPGMTLFLLGDGSVRQVNNATSHVVLQRLGCRNDGQPLDLP